MYTVSVENAITKKLAGFVEVYGFIPEVHRSNHRIDAGLLYRISQVTQIDFSGGVGITSNAPDYFLSTGLSIRLIK